MSEILNFICSIEGITAIGLTAGTVVNICTSSKASRNSKKAKNAVSNLSETVEDRKLSKQMRIVLKENEELKKSLSECMETITKIKRGK